MGWASGSQLMSDVIIALRQAGADDAVRDKVYRILIRSFEEMDCDTLTECLDTDPVYDRAYEELNPPDPWEQGLEAGYNGDAAKTCPYADGAPERDRWLAGWEWGK